MESSSVTIEVTYIVSDCNLTETNTTDLSTIFTIPSLTPGTNVTEISVSAYTSVGRGDPGVIPNLMTYISLPCTCKFFSFAGLML